MISTKKIPSLIVLSLVFCCTGFSGDASPTVFPTEIKLTNGATLRNTSLVRWTADSVVVKHAGGADPIRFVNIAEPYRARVLAFRDTPRSVAGIAEEPLVSKYMGQVFIATRGAGNYKIGGVTVYAFPLSALSNFQTVVSTVDLPKPLGSGVTDADGNFALLVPAKSEFFLFAQAQRQTGRYGEEYEWRVPMSELKNPAAVQLSNGNHLSRLSRIRIAE